MTLTDVVAPSMDMADMEALCTRLRAMADLTNYPATETSREDNPRPAITDPWKPQASWTMRHPIGATLVIAHHAECHDSPSFKKLSFYLQAHDRIGDTLIQMAMPDASIDPAFDFAYPDRYRRVLLDMVSLATKHYATSANPGSPKLRRGQSAVPTSSTHSGPSSPAPFPNGLLARQCSVSMLGCQALSIPLLAISLAFSCECGTLTIDNKAIVGEGLTALASALGNALEIVVTRSNRDMRKSALTDIRVTQITASSDEATGQDSAVDILKAVALCGVDPSTIEVMLEPDQ